MRDILPPDVSRYPVRPERVVDPSAITVSVSLDRHIFAVSWMSEMCDVLRNRGELTEVEAGLLLSGAKFLNGVG